MTASVPSGVDRREVIWPNEKLILTSEDGTANSIPQTGRVTITPAVTSLIVTSLEEPLTLTAYSGTTVLDADGRMHAFLVCTDDEDIEPHNSWTYTFRGDWVGSPTVTCPVPMVDVDPATGRMPPLNLSTVVSRASVSGVLITKGAPGAPGATIESIDPDGTVHLTDGSAVQWDLPPAVADDAAVAELVASDGAETKSAVDARVRAVGDGAYAPVGQIIVSATDPGASPDGTIWVRPTTVLSVLDTMTGLAARWDADALTATHGAAVVSFAPTAGTWITPLASVSGPSLTHSAINGRKALTFDGVNDFLDADHPDIATASTIFIVCHLQTTGAAGGRAVASMTSAAYRAIRLSSAGSTGGMVTSGSAPNSLYDAWTDTSGWRIIAAVFDGASSRLYRHKRTPLTGQTNLAVQADLRLGRGPATSAEYSKIDIADLAIVERACTDAEVKAVLDELAARYGQTLGA